jgi:hypothetical protein
MYFDEGFAADEAGLFMLPGYILMAMPNGSGKLREEVKLPGKELRQPWRCWTVLDGAGMVIKDFLESQNS